MPVKILLADKSITIQKVVEMLFSGRDYEVLCVSDGETALREAARVNPDVVLADVDLPRVDGYTFGARLKQTPAGAQTPVILMMSRDDVYDSVKGKQSGIVDNIAKPFESQELIGKVKKALSAAPPRLTEPAAKPAPATPAPQSAARPAAPPVAPPKPKPQPTPADIFDIIQEAPAGGEQMKSAELLQEAEADEAIYEVEPEVEEIGEPLMKEATKALPVGQKAVEEMRAGLGLEQELEEIPAEIVPFESFAMAMETEPKPKPAAHPTVSKQPEPRPELVSAAPSVPVLPESELRAMAEAAMAKAAREAMAQIPPPQPPALPMHELRQMAEEIMTKTAKELMRESAPAASASPALSPSDIWSMAEETVAKIAKETLGQMPANPNQASVGQTALPEKELRSIAEETISKMALDIFKDMTPPVPKISEDTIRRGIQDAVLVVARDMAREIIEQVAWEVIPQMAEQLITEEIERLKALQ